MKSKVSVMIMPAIVLAASLLDGATPHQLRITVVERNAASGAVEGSQPSVVRKSVPGEPDREAYRFSRTVRVGSPVTEVVRIAFHQPTTLRDIDASNDFHVASTSCQMSRTYNEGDSCDVSVTLDPKGPGKRAGLLTFTSNESASPDVVGLQGDTLGAVLSFIPAQITTVPQTMPKGKPLLDLGYEVATDQGDNLYIVDAGGTNTPHGSGIVYLIDGGQALTTLVGGGTTHLDALGDTVSNAQVFLNFPTSVAVDSFLDLYTVEDNAGLDKTSRGISWNLAGLGSTPALNCTSASSCASHSVQLQAPIWVNVDDNQNIFVNDQVGYYTLPWSPNGQYELSTLDSGSLLPGWMFGVDSSDNLYSLDLQSDTAPVQCMIDGVTPATGMEWDAAGSGICGFAGNNVRSQNAEIQNTASGFAFDAAGDMYFSDPKNSVLRRVDAYNGLIRTVGGNYAAGGGYSGDGGPATSAQLDYPFSVAVDSTGNVFTIQTDPAIIGGANQFVRKVGPQGQLQFPTMLVGQTSPVETELLTNTGNDYLTVTNVLWSGANPGDFSQDPATTSCAWGAPLASGRSCQLGFQCKPTAAGVRTATITFVDNTATFQNILNLSCYAVSAPVPTAVVIHPPASGQQFIAGSTISTMAAVSNSIASPATPPTGSVNMVITNTASNSPVATFNNLLLLPAVDVSRSQTPGQTYRKAPVGHYQITATYSGDSLDAAGSATPITFSVVQVTPTVTISTPANNSQNLPGNLTASITVSNAGLTPAAPSPTGSLTVTLTNTGTSAKQTFNATLSGGSSGKTTANVPLGSLAVGNYTISAAYGGDTADAAATSATNSFSVVKLAASITIMSPAPTGFSYLTPLTYTAQVSNASLTPADPNAPTGTVTFTLTNLSTSGQANFGPYTLGAGSNNTVSISVPSSQTPGVDSYSLKAFYSGDTDNAPANSDPSQFNVLPVNPTITWQTPAAIYQGTALSSTQLDATASYNGHPVAGTMVYNPVAGTVMETVGENTLNVTFNPTDSLDYNQAFGSVQLEVLEQIQSRPAVTRLSAALNLAPGTHSLVAVYSGDAQNGVSQSDPVSQVIKPAAIRIARERETGSNP